MAKKTTSSVYVFKVALAGAKSIWRRIALRSDQTLDDLHQAIFQAFDRFDEHLYSFYFPKSKSRSRTALSDAVEYTHPYHAGGDDFFGKAAHDASEATLESLKLVPKQSFHYLFDFGDQWGHEITVEKTDEPVENGKYPRILDQRGESPPQYPEEEDYEEDEEEE